MVAIELISQFKAIEGIDYIGAEDISDRLNFFYTTLLLMTASSVVLVRTYFMQPLICHLPNTFGSDNGQLNYVNNYCWTEGTYAVPLKDFTIDNELSDGGLNKYANNKIFYYQWVPFLLSIQCLSFYLPRMLWQTISSGHVGTDITHILKSAENAKTLDTENHAKLIEHICRRLEQMFFKHRYTCMSSKKHHSRIRKFVAKYLDYLTLLTRGSGLIVFYFAIKCVYLINSLSQLFLMHKVVLQSNATNYTLPFYGAQLFNDLVKGRHWENNMIFPRVCSCAVFLRTGSHGNWQYSQCALPINMVNEKIFIFLWFWLCFISLCTAASLFHWIMRFFMSFCSVNFVRKYFKLADNYEQIKKDAQFKLFVNEFLTYDGAFILKMIALNAGDIICSEILQHLWESFLKKSKTIDVLPDLHSSEGLLAFKLDLLEQEAMLHRRRTRTKNISENSNSDQVTLRQYTRTFPGALNQIESGDASIESLEVKEPC